jgi:hypothetical protein
MIDLSRTQTLHLRSEQVLLVADGGLQVETSSLEANALWRQIDRWVNEGGGSVRLARTSQDRKGRQFAKSDW